MTEFKNFRIGDLFIIKPSKSYENNTNTFLIQENGTTPVLSNTTRNNGIGGYSLLNSTEKGNFISFSDTTVGADTMFYQSSEVIGYPHVQSMRPINFKLNERIALYIIAVIRKASGTQWNYGNKFNRKRVSQILITLPVISGTNDIDFQYMEDKVKMIEQDQLKVLANYLDATGLDNYKLTENDKGILNCKPKLHKFSLASSYLLRGKTNHVSDKGIFDIVPTKKKINANSVSFDGVYPYVARGSSNNGIRGMINYSEEYLNPANTISFGQDTATMYYQPKQYFTGDKIQIFALNPAFNRKLTPEIASYLITAANKTFTNFSWGQSSFAVDKIAFLDIYLPVNSNGVPDFDYMEKYIKVIQKLTIKNVVDFKDKELATTNDVLDK